jgi:secreted trypsin-like serine protease
MPKFDRDGSCSDLSEQDGDIAVLQIQGTSGNTMSVLSSLKIGGEGLDVPDNDPIMALGYGINTTSNPDDRKLYYVDYRFFAINDHLGVYSNDSLLNGYRFDNRFYSIVCQGDSGGGDFAYANGSWHLIGAHSWGPTPCGVYAPAYDDAFDVSADVRTWHGFIETILRQKQRGCASLGPEYVCRPRG